MANLFPCSNSLLPSPLNMSPLRDLRNLQKVPLYMFRPNLTGFVLKAFLSLVLTLSLRSGLFSEPKKQTQVSFLLRRKGEASQSRQWEVGLSALCSGDPVLMTLAGQAERFWDWAAWVFVATGHAWPLQIFQCQILAEMGQIRLFGTKRAGKQRQRNSGSYQSGGEMWD